MLPCLLTDHFPEDGRAATFYSGKSVPDITQNQNSSY